MCTRYLTPHQQEVEDFWRVGAGQPLRWAHDLFPGYSGPFIRADRRSSEARRELVVGQWGLIPWFAKERKLRFLTVNARSEEVAAKASYRHPWARGQRCVIPAAAFFEPCWETGKHIPWRFTTPDGSPWGLAGLWNTWTDPQTGECVESYTMLTLNADAHPLMSRMHKPDPKRGPQEQDKRSVVPIAPAEVDTWLHGSVDLARSLLALTPAPDMVATPMDAARPSPVGQLDL